MTKSNNTLLGGDGSRRCWWCGEDPLYMAYHDHEWGMPLDEDARMFEKMCLEGFQAGLSWLTILRKRESFRSAFLGFNYQRVAQFQPSDVERLLSDASIVRHRGKIESTINNARRALEMTERYSSIAAYFWSFEPEQARVMRRRDQIPTQTDDSVRMSKELKRLGWSFVGPTTCYALMQATGMVNDHLRTCCAWSRVDQARSDFSRPR